MAKKRSKIIGITNLDSATPEQLDGLYQNAADAYMWLYKRVVERLQKSFVDRLK